MRLPDRLRAAGRVLAAAGQAWLDDRAARIGAALAFYTALSLSPLLVIVVAVAGLVYGEEAARGGVAAQIEGLVGPQAAKTIEEVLANSNKERSGALAIAVGAVTLFVGAMGVFGELQEAMNDIWKVQGRRGRPVWAFLRARFLSFGMVLGVGFLLLVSLALSTAVSAAGHYLAARWPGAGGLIVAANFVVAFAVEMLLFGMIFKVLPDAELRWRDVALGALLTTVLFNAGKSLIVFYLNVAGVGSSFGAAGSVVALLVWIYYSTQILLFGAEVTRMAADQAHRQIPASEGAEPIPGADTPVVK